MPFSAGRFASILQGVLRIGLLVAVASCSKTTVAGVVLKFETDGTLDPDTLHVTITANGRTPLDWCYPIANPATFFPTTLAIAPNGDPTETVAVTASVLRAGVTLDVRQNYLTEVPNDRIVEYDILFGGKCSAQVSSFVSPPHGTNCPYGVAASRCPPDETCSPATGMCVVDVLGSDAGRDSSAQDEAGETGGDADATTVVPDDDADASVPDAAVPDAAMPDATPVSDVDATPPPSCVPGGPGLSNCGASQENCCTSLEVAGGTFYRTYPGAMDVVPMVGDPATVSSFRLDKYLVTVARFRQFVSAWKGGWTPPSGAGIHTHLNGGQGLSNSASAGTYEPGWVTADDNNLAPTDANLGCSMPSDGYATWTPSAGGQENLPINCVNWYESYAFCIWDGGFLPSEAEWEYAAAGGSEQRVYPWGSTEAGFANQYAIYGCDYPTLSGNCSGVVNIAPVGYATLGAGLWGQLDLAGEVWEWNADWDADYVDPCVNCAYLTAPSDAGSTGPAARVFRGGIFLNYEATLFTYIRYFHPPTDRDGSLGFRCARSGP